MKSHEQWFAELKRRRVFRVAAIYGAAGFGVLEAADIAFPRLGLPDWTVTLVLVLVLLGFPVALVLAWAYDRTPDGLRRTRPARPGELEAIAGQPARRQWATALLATLGVVALLGGGWWIGSRTAVAPASSPHDRTADSPRGQQVLAVLPFAVQGGPDVRYLGEGIVSLLSTKLDGAGDLRSVDSRSVLRLVTREGYTPGDDAEAGRMASEFSARLYVSGEIVEAAGRMQISATLNQLGGDVLASATVEGPTQDVFGLVDELTSRLLSGLSGGPAARVQRLATVTTSSVPALKAFLEGEDHFRDGRFAEAMESFRRATLEDTLFALAYYRLSIAAEWNYADQTARGAAEKAVQLSERLSERDRRLLDAYLKRRQGKNTEAAETYRSLLGTYPDELEAWLDLSEILFHTNPLHGRSFVESKETFYRVLDLDPDHSAALIHLISIASYENDLPALDTLVRRYTALDSAGDRTMRVRAIRALAHGDFATVDAAIAELDTKSEAALSSFAWGTGVFVQGLELARAASRALIGPHRSAEAVQLGYAQLAHIETAARQPDSVRAALDGLESINPGAALEHEALLAVLPFARSDREELRRLRRELHELELPASVETRESLSALLTTDDRLRRLNRYYLLGLLSAQLGEFGTAEAYADSAAGVELSIPQGSMADDLALGVRAEVARLQGRPADALNLLQQARREIWDEQTTVTPMSSQVRERFVQAELLRELGRPEEARRWYETIAQLSLVDLPYRQPAAERLAELDARRETTAGSEPTR